MFKHNEIVPFVDVLKNRIFGMDDIWNDLMDRKNTFWYDTPTYPKDNVIQLPNKILITLALAGFSKEDITIERDGNKLVVNGKGKEDQELEEGVYVYKNIAERSFTKVYTVTHEYKDISAEFKDGILSITLEKEVTPEEKKQLVEIK